MHNFHATLFELQFKSPYIKLVLLLFTNPCHQKKYITAGQCKDQTFWYTSNWKIDMKTIRTLWWFRNHNVYLMFSKNITSFVWGQLSNLTKITYLLFLFKEYFSVLCGIDMCISPCGFNRTCMHDSMSMYFNLYMY